VYLAKDARTSPQAVARMYPGLAKFNQVKLQLDPDDRFTSSLSRRLKIGAHA
jgi:decaprenylphospho-beta-D-ribofuranose 2-oxidase